MDDATYTAWIGIDVSKNTLDACLLTQHAKPRHKVFDNTPAGHAKLLRWAKHLAAEASFHFALEATGAYSSALATFLNAQQQAVSVLNPALTAHMARVLHQDTTTDKVAAWVIATYTRQNAPPLWKPMPPEKHKLLALVRLREDLLAQKVRQQNYLEPPDLEPLVRRSHQKHLRFLERELAVIEARIRDHIDQTPTLREDRKLLESIPGIGRTTAQTLLAELPDVGAFADARKLACYAGLNPRERQSGTSVWKRPCLSKRGKVSLRASLYLPAMSAIVWNPLVKAFYSRLLQNGKCKMSALCAAMRKLLMLCYGVLKSRKEFDPEHLTVSA